MFDRSWCGSLGVDAILTGGKVLAVKLSQQLTNRKSEVDLISRAKARGVVDHLPEILKSKDLWKLSDGVRHRFALTEHWDDRVLRRIVSPCYVPLAERLVEEPDSLKTMVRQMLQCKLHTTSSIAPVDVSSCRYS